MFACYIVFNLEFSCRLQSEVLCHCYAGLSWQHQSLKSKRQIPETDRKNIITGTVWAAVIAIIIVRKRCQYRLENAWALWHASQLSRTTSNHNDQLYWPAIKYDITYRKTKPFHFHIFIFLLSRNGWFSMWKCYRSYTHLSVYNSGSFLPSVTIYLGAFYMGQLSAKRVLVEAFVPNNCPM